MSNASDQAVNWHVQPQSGGNYLLWPTSRSGGKLISAAEYQLLLRDADEATAGKLYFQESLLCGIAGLALFLALSFLLDVGNAAVMGAVIGAIGGGQAIGRGRDIATLMKSFVGRPDAVRARSWWERVRGNTAYSSPTSALLLILIGGVLIIALWLVDLGDDFRWLAALTGFAIAALGGLTLLARRVGPVRL